MKKIIATLLFFFLSAQVQADSVSHSGQLQRIYPLSDGAVVIVFKNPSTSCNRSDNYHFMRVGSNGLNEEGLKNIYSLALLAASSGKKLTINFSSTNSECAINRAFVEY